MAAPTAAQCHALTTYYIKGFKAKYGNEPNVNRNIARQAFAGILMDINSEEVKSLIDYYFTTPPTGNKQHSLNWFLYNYDKVKDALVETANDRDSITALMRRSEEKAREWRERAESRVIGN